MHLSAPDGGSIVAWMTDKSDSITGYFPIWDAPSTVFRLDSAGRETWKYVFRTFQPERRFLLDIRISRDGSIIGCGAADHYYQDDIW